MEIETGERSDRSMPAAEHPRAPSSKRRSGRTRYGELQREAQRRRHSANQTMVVSLLLLVALVVFFYRVLSG